MPKIVIIYYSRTGNTEKMAQAIQEGIQGEPHVEAKLLIDFEVKPQELELADAIVVGAPTYHHDMPRGIKQVFENMATQAVNLTNKVGASFGSFGWSGEAPRLTLEIMEHKFEMNVIKPPLLIKYQPDNAALNRCREFGRDIAKKLRGGKTLTH